MHRYYFSTSNGDVHEDVDGTLLPDPDTAKLEGAKILGQILRDHPERLWEGGDLTLQVTDDAGSSLFEILISTSLEVGRTSPEETGIGLN
jgi:hypothetical protein